MIIIPPQPTPEVKIDVGSIIKLTNTAGVLVVTRAETVSRRDPQSGYDLMCDEIEGVMFAVEAVGDDDLPNVRTIRSTKMNDLEVCFNIPHSTYGFNGKGTKISYSDIKVIGTCKVEKTVVVTYSLTMDKQS